jgi:hypothetical protein
MESMIFKSIYRYSFIIVALFLIVFESILIMKGNWHGDFWEHSAVVNELSKHLIHPNNPIIKTNTPHAFFSPYSLLVAMFSRITYQNSIQSLEYFAFFNLLFFLISFYLFCKNIFGENHNSIATLSLILILFFWGKNPFVWSGFYHFMGLHWILPYPSTFALSLSFLILSIVAKKSLQKYYLNSLVVIILSAVVFITHPPTGIFLSIGIIVMNFSFNSYSIKQCIIKSSIIIIPVLILCLLWPYFNFIDLLVGNNFDLNRVNKAIYSRIISIYWPVLLIIPTLFFVNKNKIYNFFLIAIILMAIVYIGGYIFKINGVSRLISNIMMFAQFLIAYSMVDLIKEHRVLGKVYFSTFIFAIIVSLWLNFIPLVDTFLRVLSIKKIEYYSKYDFLRNLVTSDDIILSDANSNWIIPSFNGKVISTKHAICWINDINERRNAVNSFFTIENPDTLRQNVIRKYNPDYLLIDYDEVHFENSTLQWLKSIGYTVYYKDQLELIKFKK